MIPVLKEQREGCTIYKTEEGAVLFSTELPLGETSIWTWRYREGFSFSVGRRVFRTERGSINGETRIWCDGAVYGSFQDTYPPGVKLWREGKCEAWMTARGWVLPGDQGDPYEGWRGDGARCFVLRVPFLSQWWGGLSTWKKTAAFVGEFDPAAQDDPSVALVFMYGELFFPIGD